MARQRKAKQTKREAIIHLDQRLPLTTVYYMRMQ